MAEPRSDKVAEVEELEQRLRSSTIVILTDYRGLTVGEIGALRGKLRGASLEYRVAKNTLLGRAAERVGVVGLEPHLTGPTAVVFGRDDPGVPARLLQEFIRQYRKLEIKGGVIEGQTLDAAEVQALASLPSKLELVALVVGAVQGPLFALVTVLNAAPRGLVTALEALRKKREAASPAPAVPEPQVPSVPVESSPTASAVPEPQVPSVPVESSSAAPAVPEPQAPSAPVESSPAASADSEPQTPSAPAESNPTAPASEPS